MALRRRNASYVINPKSQVPADMAIGKMVSILPLLLPLDFHSEAHLMVPP